MPSALTMMFCGDTSRCTMPSGWLRVVGRLVRGSEAREHSGRERDDDAAAAIGSPRQARGAEEPVERDPVHVLLHEDDLVRRRQHDVEHGHDVRVMDLRRDLGLVAEHLDEVRVLGELRVQPLGGDDAAEAVVAHEAGEVDGRHPSARDGRVEDVTTERAGLPAVQVRIDDRADSPIACFLLTTTTSAPHARVRPAHSKS